MAYVSVRNNEENSLVSRLATLRDDLRARAAKRRVYRETIAELRMLSDRELKDLGLNRSIIRRVAWQAAYDN